MAYKIAGMDVHKKMLAVVVAGMMTAPGLQIASPEDSLARLGVIANGIIIVNIVLRVRISGCRRLPVRI